MPMRVTLCVCLFLVACRGSDRCGEGEPLEVTLAVAVKDAVSQELVAQPAFAVDQAPASASCGSAGEQPCAAWSVIVDAGLDDGVHELNVSAAGYLAAQAQFTVQTMKGGNTEDPCPYVVGVSPSSLDVALAK
jgi:hypothetical protein